MAIHDYTADELGIPESCRAVVVRPGDHLIIGLHDPSPDPRHLAKMRADLLDRLPGVEVTVIAGVSDFAVYHPDALVESTGRTD